MALEYSDIDAITDIAYLCLEAADGMADGTHAARIKAQLDRTLDRLENRHEREAEAYRDARRQTRAGLRETRRRAKADYALAEERGRVRHGLEAEAALASQIAAAEGVAS